jgi:hypothetical protein
MMITSDGARILALQTPGTGEALYRAAGDRVSSEADASRPPDWERLRAAAERSETIELLGPPPFAVVRQEAASVRS